MRRLVRSREPSANLVELAGVVNLDLTPSELCLRNRLTRERRDRSHPEDAAKSMRLLLLLAFARELSCVGGRAGSCSHT